MGTRGDGGRTRGMDPPEEGLVVYKGPSSKSSGMRRRSAKDQCNDRNREGLDRPPPQGADGTPMGARKMRLRYRTSRSTIVMSSFIVGRDGLLSFGRIGGGGIRGGLSGLGLGGHGHTNCPPPPHPPNNAPNPPEDDNDDDEEDDDEDDNDE